MNENAASPGYGLSFVEKDGCPRRVVHPRCLRLSGALLPGRHDGRCPCQARRQPAAAAIEKQIESEPYATAMKQILERAQERSADGYTLTRDHQGDREAGTERRAAQVPQEPRQSDCRAAQQRGRPARVVHALSLEDGRRRQELVDYLQVFNSPTDYKLFNPQSGEQGQPANLLLWEYNSGALLDVTGGHNSRVTFSMIEQEQPVNVAWPRSSKNPR
jgi:hypothetical protein